MALATSAAPIATTTAAPTAVMLLDLPCWDGFYAAFSTASSLARVLQHTAQATNSLSPWGVYTQLKFYRKLAIFYYPPIAQHINDPKLATAFLEKHSQIMGYNASQDPCVQELLANLHLAAEPLKLSEAEFERKYNPKFNKPKEEAAPAKTEAPAKIKLDKNLRITHDTIPGGARRISITIGGNNYSAEKTKQTLENTYLALASKRGSAANDRPSIKFNGYNKITIRNPSHELRALLSSAKLENERSR